MAKGMVSACGRARAEGGVNIAYEHVCEHHARFISYPEEKQPFCALCEIERLMSVKERLVDELKELRRSMLTRVQSIEWILGMTEPEQREGEG